jgi:hypothetical protein
MTPWISIVTCVCFVTCFACSKSVWILPQSYEVVDLEDGTLYRLETTSGEVYKTKRLTRDETGFQVQIRKKVMGKTGRSHREWTEPIHIPFENVKSLETIDFQEGRTALVVVASIAAVGGVLFALAMQSFSIY